MAEQVGKFLTELPELETPTDGDLMYIVDDETTSKKVTMSNLKRVLGGNVTGTVEGASVSFSDGADGIPMKECDVTIVPTQDLHGYSKPWAGGSGKNKLNASSATTNTLNGVTFTVVKNDANEVIRIDVTGTANAGTTFSIGTATIEAGTYIFSGYTDGSSVGTKYINYSGIVNAYGSDATATITETKTTTVTLQIGNGAETEFTIYPMIREATAPSEFEPYSNICPISGHTDVKVTVASTSGGSGEDTTVSLGRTVYGGSLDVTTGVLTVDKVSIDLGNYNWVNENDSLSGLARIPLDEVRTLGAIYNQTPICSNYEGKTPKGYSQFNYGEIAFSNSEQYPLIRLRDANLSSMTDSQIKAYLSGVKFCYELATPQTFNLTPTQVETLLGQNYVSHDGGGNIKVVYIRDLDITINDLINRVTALENE